MDNLKDIPDRNTFYLLVGNAGSLRMSHSIVAVSGKSLLRIVENERILKDVLCDMFLNVVINAATMNIRCIVTFQ